MKPNLGPGSGTNTPNITKGKLTIKTTGYRGGRTHMHRVKGFRGKGGGGLLK